MARCSRCNKFSLFKSFKNGLCDECKDRLEEERREAERERERMEREEQQRKEQEEKKRREAEEEAERKLKDLLVMPPKFHGSILAYDYEDVNLFVPNADTFSDLSIGFKLYAYQEKDNVHDPNAVCFHNSRITYAYFFKGKLQDMANDYLSCGGDVMAIVTDMNPDEKKISAHIGYFKQKDQDEFKSYIRKNKNAKTYRLTGNTSEEKQFNLACSKIGEKCEIEYDFDKDKYIVINGDEIGYLPATGTKIINEHGEDNCSVFIADIGENDSGKSYACVYIFTE